MPTLLTSDLHLTNRPEDEYRWIIFEVLGQLIGSYHSNCSGGELQSPGIDVIILGDLTDRKDEHSSHLANKIVDSLINLGADRVTILMGNHDYVDPKTPYFKFLNSISYGDEIHFVYEKGEVNQHGLVEGKSSLFLPHTRDYVTDWGQEFDYGEAKFVFMHQTVHGSVASNGSRMEGIPTAYFNKVPKDVKIFSGDIHVPQKIGRVEYVGSPYPVRFGDTFQPQIIELDGDTITRIPIDIIQKPHLFITRPEDVAKASLRRGDQLRVTFKIGAEEAHSFQAMKEELVKRCEKDGIRLFGVDARVSYEAVTKNEDPSKTVATHETPKQALGRFLNREGIAGNTAKAGRRVLDEVEKA